MTAAAKSGTAGSGSPACSATVWRRSDRHAATPASRPAGACRPCSTTSSRPEPSLTVITISDYPMSWYWRAASQRDVAVAATALRRVRDGARERLPGPGRLDDLIHYAQRLGPVQAASFPLVLGGEVRLDLVELVWRHVGEGAPVQDADRGHRAHHRDLGARPGEHL